MHHLHTHSGILPQTSIWGNMALVLLPSEAECVVSTGKYQAKSVTVTQPTPTDPIDTKLTPTNAQQVPTDAPSIPTNIQLPPSVKDTSHLHRVLLD
mmetsp:Transcript_103787/g.178817  ORF Transcript_103787/g.178817 Transcript_103787/m.178817 type:complete len:96 (-) Transcript_103787:474-761(-)